MRIHRLQVAGIGPYRREFTIDFDQFTNGKFLISGNTGAGKSMLVDAIYFGLFGTVTSDENGAATRLRSRFCTAREKSRVMVEFSTASGMYRIERTPSYDKPGRKTPVSGQAVLWRIAKAGAEEAQHIASKPREVGTELARILPLDASQYRQIAVLPQGRFERFLLSHSEDRKKILESIFGTQIYQDFETRLHQAAVAARTEADLVYRKITAFAPHLEDADLPPLPAQRVRHYLTDARVTRSEARQRQELLAGCLERAEGELAAREAAVRLLLATNELVRRKRALSQRYAQLGRELDRWAVGRVVLQRHEQAARVWERETEVATARRDLDGAEAGAPRTAGGEVLSTAAAEAAVTRAIKIGERIKSLEERAAQIARTRTLVATREEEAAELAARLSADQERGEELAARVRELGQAHSALADPQPVLDAALARAEAAQATLQEWETWTAYQNRLCGARQALDIATREAAAAEGIYREVEAAWVADSAADLARYLQPDQPCPVCGGVEHPNPASGQVPSGQAGADQVAGRTLADMTAALADWERARERRARAGEELAQLQDQAPPDPGAAAPGLDEAAAQGAHEEAVAAVAQARAANERWRDLLDQLGTARAELEQVTDKLAPDREKLAQLRQGIETHTTQLGELEEAQREASARLWHDLDPAGTEVADPSVEGAKAVAGAALEQAKRDREAVGALLLARQRWDDAVARRDEELANCGFTSVDAARRGLLTPAQVRRWQDAAADRWREYRAVRTDLLERQLRAVGDCEEAVEPAQERAQAARAQVDGFNRRLGGARTELASAERRVADLEATAAQWRKIWEQSQQLLELDEVVSNANGASLLGMPLSTWILTQRLDDILEVASAKLDRMSGGNFQFRRHNRDGSRRQDQALTVGIYVAGQDEVVFPSSLSGGERFMASLSLALALIEVIQAEAGGVSIETMFIDEGFGTLDEARLQLVMNQLQLETGKDRTIGIISHVEELKRSIGDRIEVSANSAGEAQVSVRA